jgi:hypothetical protein
MTRLKDGVTNPVVEASGTVPDGSSSRRGGTGSHQDSAERDRYADGLAAWTLERLDRRNAWPVVWNSLGTSGAHGQTAALEGIHVAMARSMSTSLVQIAIQPS